MDIKLFQLSALASIFLAVGAMPSNRPGYIECIDSNECGKGKCCMIGMGRYSIPMCQPMGDLGDMCIPDSSPQKRLDLSYPDNSTVYLTNVYYNLCPCMGGLSCSRESGRGTCEDPSIHVSFNYIDY